MPTNAWQHWHYVHVCVDPNFAHFYSEVLICVDANQALKLDLELPKKRLQVEPMSPA